MIKPLSKRQLLHLCTLLRRYIPEVRHRRGVKVAEKAQELVEYLEDYIATMHHYEDDTNKRGH